MVYSIFGDFIIDLTWYTTVLSFVILLLRRILKKKTIFDLLYRKRDQATQQNIIYNSDLDRVEREFPSLFNKIFDKTLSIIIVVDSTNYSIVNHFTEIIQFFNHISIGQGLKYFTYEFIIVNNNILNSSDIQYLQMQQNVRIITLNKSMGKGTAIQIGSFSTNGRYILYLSLSNPIQSLYKFINFFKVQINDEYCTFLPVRQNCPQLTYLQKYLVYRQYIDKIHDYNFESFIISRKLAQIVLEDIHFSTHNCFNLEFLMILKYYHFIQNQNYHLKIISEAFFL